MAHPSEGRAAARGSTRIIASATDGHVTDTIAHHRPADVARAAPPLAPPRTFFASARRLHVLATFEILHRMLLSELRPTERPLASGIDFTFATLCIFERPLNFSQPSIASSHGETSLERMLVRVQCQLAPPAV
jgi:hypothetical protein